MKIEHFKYIMEVYFFKPGSRGVHAQLMKTAQSRFTQKPLQF